MALEGRASDCVASKEIQKDSSAVGKASKILERIIEFQPYTILDSTTFGIGSPSVKENGRKRIG